MPAVPSAITPILFLLRQAPEKQLLSAGPDHFNIHPNRPVRQGAQQQFPAVAPIELDLRTGRKPRLASLAQAELRHTLHPAGLFQCHRQQGAPLPPRLRMPQPKQLCHSPSPSKN